MVSDEFKEKQKTPDLVEGEPADTVQKSKSKPVSFAHSFCLHGLLSYILGLVILIARVLFAGLFVLPWPPVIVAAAMIGYVLVQFQKAL